MRKEMLLVDLLCKLDEYMDVQIVLETKEKYINADEDDNVTICDALVMDVLYLMENNIINNDLLVDEVEIYGCSKLAIFVRTYKLFGEGDEYE